MAFTLAKSGLAWYVKKMPTYSTLYGTFATVPILLLWTYIVWVIVLTGALIAASAPALRRQGLFSARAPGHAFVLVAFTIVVLGGMGSFVGAAIGGFLIGVTESLGGLLLGEQLGQIGISLIFILILLLKPTGLFGSRA